MFGRETFIVRIVKRVVDADNDIQGVVVPVGHKVRVPPSAGGREEARRAIRGQRDRSAAHPGRRNGRRACLVGLAFSNPEMSLNEE